MESTDGFIGSPEHIAQIQMHAHAVVVAVLVAELVKASPDGLIRVDRLQSSVDVFEASWAGYKSAVHQAVAS